MINLAHTPEKSNPADLLTNPLGPQQHYPLVEKFLVSVHFRLQGGVRDLGLNSLGSFYKSCMKALD